MFLTRECDYGVRIIRALSCGSKKTISTIAEEEKMPYKYAYKIIKKLVQSGFINSTRGRVGGYHLKRPLNELKLLDIISAVDTNRYFSDCLRSDYECSYKNGGGHVCQVHEELIRVQDVVHLELARKTMDEILNIKGDANV